MIQSMTGYAATQLEQPPYRVELRVRAVNSKYLDLMIRLAHPYQALEDRVRRMATAQLVRGRIEMRFQISTGAAGNISYQTHLQRTDAYVKALKRVQQRYGIKAPIPLDCLLQAGAVEPMEVTPDLEALWPSLEQCLETALKELVAMRNQEGVFLSTDFNQRLENIESHLDRVAVLNQDLLPKYRDRLEERLKSLTNGMLALDSDRILQEAALLADRSDISEEVLRTRSHIQQFRDYMESSQPSGRKLNFLLQELNREANTMGSKLDGAKVTHHVVEIKTEIEKIREQVQNVL